MELLLWLAEVEIWRLQRKEHEAMANDKITGKPRGLKQDNRFGDLYPDVYQQAEEHCYEIIATQGLEALSREQVAQHGWSETWLEEIAPRVIDDYRHRTWKRQ